MFEKVTYRCGHEGEIEVYGKADKGGKTIGIGDFAIRVDWNLEGNDFKITLTGMYSSGVLNRIKYFEINKLFGIG